MEKALKDNQGFSLMELIVSMLVASLVMIAIVGVMNVSMQSYKNNTFDAQLQIEYQILQSKLRYTMLTATKMEERTLSGGKAFVFQQKENKKIAYYYFKEGKVYYKRVDESAALDDTGIAALAVGANYLANYIPSSNVAIHSSKEGNVPYYEVSVKMEYAGRSFDSGFVVSSRDQGHGSGGGGGTPTPTTPD